MAKITHRAILPALAAAGFMVCAATAQAQVTAAQQNAIKSNCRSDFMSKCSGVSPGGKEALACLQKNVASLSAACKGAVSATLPPPPPAAAKPPEPATPIQAATPPAAPTAPAAAAPAPAAQPVVAPAPPKPAQPPKATIAAPPKAVAKPKAVAATAAPTAAQQAAIKQACTSDFMAKCRGVQPGGKDALACLQKNAGGLSANCKQAVSAIPGAAAAPMPVATAPAEAAPAAPAAPHQATIVDAAVMLRACKMDLVRHCRGVQPGGGRALACLTANQSDLSIRCKTAMKVTSPLR